MRTPPPRRNALRVWLIALAWSAPWIFGGPSSTVAWGGKQKTRQVTICGIIATPGGTTIDPKLAKIAPQLRKLLPMHGFKLLDVQSKQLHPGQSVSCNLQAGGYTADAVLENPQDDNGKVQVRCQLSLHMVVQVDTLVTTPPNQLFFCDQALSNGSHLLIGVGAR